MPVRQAAGAITDHLLDRVLPAAYTRRPGQPSLPYDLATAQRALTRIAARMNKDGARDLNWWEIPAWAPRTPRVTTSFIAGALTAGITAGITAGLMAGVTAGLVVGFWFGFMGGFAAGFAGVGGNRPRIIGNLRITRGLTPKNLLVELAAGIVVGLAFGGAVGIVAGIVFGLTAGLAAGLLNVLTADPDGV